MNTKIEKRKKMDGNKKQNHVENRNIKAQIYRYDKKIYTKRYDIICLLCILVNRSVTKPVCYFDNH